MTKRCLGFWLWLWGCLIATHAQPPITQPRLILQITVDQFAGNQLDHYHNQHAAQGGFAWLLQHGYWYDNAHHPHATTQTAPGHTTLATGAGPAVHGIIANQWWDRDAHQKRYALADSRYPILGDDRKECAQFGRSPTVIQAPSFADSLAIATLGQAKRFALSTKDRGAIPLAGQMGQAFWFDTHQGRYVTSSYYAKTLPQWLLTWQQQHPANDYLNQQWRPLKPCRYYNHCLNRDNPFTAKPSAFGTQFPHPFGHRANETFYDNLTTSPMTDSLTLSLAKSLISAEKLGTHPIPDYLSISLSATDGVGHRFGPHSYESEDNFIRLDKELGDFFRYIDQQIGLNHVLIVFSADHGMPPTSGWMAKHGYPVVEAVDPDRAQPPAGIKAYLKQHQLDWQKLLIFTPPDLYLNDDYLKHQQVDKTELVSLLNQYLPQLPGVAYAVATDAVLGHRWQHPYLSSHLEHQLYRGRSGDLYVVTRPYSVPATVATHGSPWAYDTHVPIIFAHPSLQGSRIHHRVSTTDIAVTLSALTHAPAPAAATGKVLTEFE